MNNHITYTQAISMLNSMDMRYEILQLANGWKAIVTEYSGRLLGPFKDENSESVLWVNEAMKDQKSFRQFVENKQLHLGGERFWVNPELRFYCKAPELFDATYTVQEQIDPGHYNLTRNGNELTLDMSVSLNDLNNGREKRMYVSRRYTPAANPLEYIGSLKDVKVDYCGYMQDVELRDEQPDYNLAIEPWILTQVNPDGGKFVTPIFGESDFVDYYIPVEDMQTFHDGYAELTATGDRKYKVSYRSAQTCGRMAFVKPMDGRWHLMVRNYYNDPSVPYVSEPWGDLGNKGCSTYYYNDDLSNGGFAEFENGGTTIGGATGRSVSYNTTSLWFFFGSQEDIQKIMKVLLGIDYKF